MDLGPHLNFLFKKKYAKSRRKRSASLLYLFASLLWILLIGDIIFKFPLYRLIVLWVGRVSVCLFAMVYSITAFEKD